MMNNRSTFLMAMAMMSTLLFVSCSEEDKPMAEDDLQEEPGTKPTATSIRFEATGIDCGLTDGFSNQQHVLPELVHLNLDKCNGETFRPTLTLHFEQGKTIATGTYTLASTSTPGSMEFTINSDQYNYTNWIGTAGSVVVVQNSEDATKIDIELKSITMTNQTASDPKNPATDTLKGYIIKI